MPDDTLPEPASVSPLAALRRHWVLTALLTGLGLLGGLYVGNVRPVMYTAQARLAVGGQGIASFQIPGYALAAQEVAANYARYVGLPQSQATFLTALGADAAKVSTVVGSPIAESNIVLVEVSATDRAVSVRAAAAVAATLLSAANRPATTAASYLQQYTAVSATLHARQATLAAAKAQLAVLTAAKARPRVLAAQQDRVNRLTTAVSTLTIEQSTLGGEYTTAVTGATAYTRLEVAQPAVITRTSHRSSIERYGVAGFVGGVLLAMALGVLLERRAARWSAGRPGRRSRGRRRAPAAADRESELVSSRAGR